MQLLDQTESQHDTWFPNLWFRLEAWKLQAESPMLGSFAYEVRIRGRVGLAKAQTVNLLVIMRMREVTQILVPEADCRLVGFTARRAAELFTIRETGEELKLSRRQREMLLLDIRAIIQSELKRREEAAANVR